MFGANPVNVIDPVAVAQFVGLLTLLPLMFGVGLIMTVVVPGAEGQLPTVVVAITEYTPASASVILLIDGFCVAFENPFGPVHAYVTPGETVFAVKFNVPPEQTGELLPAVGVAGVGFTVTFTVPAAEVQLLSVAVTLYTPLAATDALVIDGFCKLLAKPFGPFHEYVTPGVAELAVKFKVLPLQMGPLLPVTGTAGGVGSDKVKGPTILEEHPFNTTLMFV